MNASWVKYLPGFIRAKMEARPGLQSVIGNSGWLFAEKILRMGAGLLVGVWIARYLGPAQFGLWNYATAFAAIFGAFASLGLDGIVIRELVKHPERQNQILGSAFILKLVGGVATLLISGLAIFLLRSGDPLTIGLVGISAAGFIFQSVNVIDFNFQAKVQSRNTVMATTAAFLLMTGVKVFLILSSAPLIAFAWAGLAEMVLTALFLMAAYQLNHLDIREWRCERQVMHALLKESWPLILAGLAVMLYMRIDILMLQEMVGDREVGIYAAATRLSEIWYFLPAVIISSVSPSIIKSHADDAVLYFRKLRNLYLLMVCLAIGVALPASILSNLLVNILYGDEFKDAAIVLAIHLWASIAVFLGMASSQHLLAENLQKISFYRTLIGLASNICLNFLLIPKMGAKGAAIATVISYFVATFSLFFFRQTRSHFIYFFVARSVGR